jgi:hypothetical protein
MLNELTLGSSNSDENMERVGTGIKSFRQNRFALSTKNYGLWYKDRSVAN